MVNVGLIGFGLSGRYFHAPFIKVNPRLNLVKVLTSKPESVKAFDAEIGVVNHVDSILNDPKIDLVFVCTPNDSHFDYAIKVLRAGKNVVIEKPFANTVREAELLIEEAEKRDLVLTAYQNRRWDADFLTVQKVLASGELGEIIEFESHYDRFRLEVLSDTWKEVQAAGSGNLFNLGPHLIDQALILFGTPESVTAKIKTVRPFGKTDDYFDIALDYNDKRIILKSSILAFNNDLRYVIHGTKGSFIKKGLDVQEPVLKTNVLPNIKNWGKESESMYGNLYTINGTKTIESELGNYSPFYDNLADAVLDKKALLVTPQQVLNTTKIIELAQKSNRLSKTISTNSSFTNQL